MVAPVIVISGLSGAGKSTLGERLQKLLQAEGQKVSLIDGDTLRNFFEGGLGYSGVDRLLVSKIMAYSAAQLSQQGVYVILATMLSQEGARAFLHRKAPFIEIFLDADFSTCRENDIKGVYKNNMTIAQPNIVGHDIGFSKPENPDLVLKTHCISIDESFNQMVDFLCDKNILSAHLLGVT